MLWKNLRIPVLIATCGSVFLILGKNLLGLSASGGAIAYQLPSSVPLSNWQFVQSSALDSPPDESRAQVAGTLYQYRQGSRDLTIEMRYLVNGDAQVRNLLLKYGKPGTDIPFPSTIQQDSETGYISLFNDQKNAYLTSCINPRGNSTVTNAQFSQNSYAYNFRLDRLLPVLIGQETLRDGRCLWTYMVMPLSQKSSEESYQILKETWKNWHQWWQPRFPQS